MADQPPIGRRGKAADKAASTTKPAAGGAGKHAKPSWPKRLLTALKFTAIIGLALALIGVAGTAVAYNTIKLPDPNADFTTNTSYVLYRDGTTRIGSFATQNRVTIDFATMPTSIKDAVIAAENRSFWTDKGISPSGLARALYTVVRGGDLQGGSTITQQFIKIFYLTSDRTPTRKLKEILLAVKMGRDVPKNDVLADYLNTIYFGRGAYGVQTAAKAYFNVDAKDLTLQQSAVLASVLNNPGLMDPSDGANNLKRLTSRYGYVLDGMLEQGNITQTEHDAAASALPAFPDVPKSSRYGGPKGFLLKMVESELLANGFSSAQISGGGLQIITTFDSAAQEAAVAAAQKYTEQAASSASKKQDPAQLHAAIASVQVGTGELLALYGGPDYVANSRNWATTDRMAASTFKTYAAAAALRDGKNLNTPLNGDTFTPKGDKTTVRNEFSMQYGDVTLTRALTDSINTAFVDLTQQMTNGPQKVVKAANDAGVPTGAGWDLNNRIALGSAEASPLDQAMGYATFANNGEFVPTHVVNEVKDSSGTVVYKTSAPAKRTFDVGVAQDITYALSTVVEQGTGQKVNTLGRPVAGKTGTAGIDRNNAQGKLVNEVVSSWFVAYTKQVSTAVMFVAGDDGLASLDPYARRGDATFFGGTYPALTWADYMKVATANDPVVAFDPPAYVNGGKKTTPTPTTATPTVAPSETPSATSPPSSAAPTSAPPPTTTSARPPTTAPPSGPPSTPPPSTRQPSTGPTGITPPTPRTTPS